MKYGTTKTLRIGGILLAIFFLVCAFALLPQTVRAQTVTATVTVGYEPIGVAVTPNGAYAYVANNGGGSVSVISTATNTVTAKVPVGNLSKGVAVTPNGAYVYVTNEDDGTVSVINTVSSASPTPTSTSTSPTATPTSTTSSTQTPIATPTSFKNPTSSPTVPEFPTMLLALVAMALIVTASLFAYRRRNPHNFILK